MNFSNFDIVLNSRIIIANSIEISAIIIALVIYYKKIGNLKLPIYLLVVGYIGSELISLVEEYLLYSSTNFSVKNGSRISGAILFGFILYLFSQKNNSKNYFYVLIASIFGIFSIGKWHCFIRGDSCYGIPNNSIFGFTINGVTPSISKVHPVPLYDSFISIIILVLLFLLKKHITSNYKLLFLTGMLLISIQGFLMEYLRINRIIFLHMTINQICYLFLTFLILNEYKKHLTNAKKQ